MNREERIEQINIYGQAYPMLLEALDKFPEEMWKFKPSEKSWSIHEIIVHITDSEVNSYIRCRCFLAEPGKTVMAYDQDAWAVKLKYHSQSTSEALTLFRMLREASNKLIQNLPEEVWANEVNHPENGRMSMDDWLFTYASHIPVHIRQMNRVYERWQKSQSQEQQSSWK